jgi:hypothetical protein
MGTPELSSLLDRVEGDTERQSGLEGHRAQRGADPRCYWQLLRRKFPGKRGVRPDDTNRGVVSGNWSLPRFHSPGDPAAI